MLNLRQHPWICVLLLYAAPNSVPLLAADVDFNRDIRPLLSNNCFQCHGPDSEKREAELRFDTEAGAKAKLDEGHAIVPGKPGSSLLVERVFSDDPDLIMPPPDSGKTLSSQQKKMLRQWIAAGADWSQHWAYEPPIQHPVPNVTSPTDWQKNRVDHFILSRLEQENLTPSPDADPITLIRRVTFDLTGLPPTLEDVRAFVADPSDTAFANVVDRLLDSPHFGERMAVYWLDLVRYADTVGYHGDQDHNISPYRDYVIDAFNRNLPFDRFTREQLAGDLLADSGIDQKVASGYNRLLQTTHEGGLQPREYRAIYAADRIRNLSNVWMGATVGCAQCHDHKYDPYTSHDFYSLSAFFADIDDEAHFKDGSNALPTKRKPELKVLSRRERELLAELNEQLKSTSKPEELKVLKGRIQTLEKSSRLTMVTAALKTSRTVRLLPRGNWLDESGPVVQPAVPKFLGTLDVGDRRATRLDLANWLTDSKSGVGLLTARVFANRFWYLAFGTGISRGLDDFGGQGQPPVHPQLLDNLAIEFVDSGWDVKAMLRLIFNSRTYRQSSKTPDSLFDRDPYNQLLARQSRFRLSAETVRDTALQLSGLLVDEFGGASVRPYQPAGYYRHLNFPTRKYSHDANQGQWRRGVYVHWQRQFLHPMMKAFDAPTREECTAQRPRSNTPLAALTLLNDPSFVEAARGFATRIYKEGGASDASRIAYGFRLATSREPDELEAKLLLSLLKSNRKYFVENSNAALEFLAIGLAESSSEIKPVELAAWTTAARAILNLSETISRN